MQRGQLLALNLMFRSWRHGTSGRFSIAVHPLIKCQRGRIVGKGVMTNRPSRATSLAPPRIPPLFSRLSVLTIADCNGQPASRHRSGVRATSLLD